MHIVTSINLRGFRCDRRVLAAFVVALTAAMAGLTPSQARPDGDQPPPSVQPPEFTVMPSRGLVGSFGGFGDQLNQHVYAKLSGPPPGLLDLEAKVLKLAPPFARIFFNTTEWTFPDRMASFLRTVALAQRAHAQINITWQGSTYVFARANMDRFAEVLGELLEHANVTSLWVTLFNEPNSTRITLAQYEEVYRILDSELRHRGLRDRVHFMGGDLVGPASPSGQTQGDWLRYIAGHMGDLLDAWSIHVYWDFWDTAKIERRLTEVRTIFASIPEEQRRPLYVTEFGIRGLRTFEGEPNPEAGLYPDGTTIEATTKAAFEEAWFMIRATELSYAGTAQWDLYDATYDVGTQDYSAIGPPGVDGWTIRPLYRLLQLMTLTTRPVGGTIVEVVPTPGSGLTKRLTAYVSPPGDMTILGLDTRGAAIGAGWEPVTYSLSGLTPNTRFRLLVWNADGTGTNREIGFIDSDSNGTIQFAVPVQAVFALTTMPLGALTW